MNLLTAAPFSDDMLRRVCGEYLEMPGMRLKSEQAQRLWGLDQQTCARLLEALVAQGFLCRDSNGQYARSSDGAAAPLQMAKADRVFRAVPQRRATDAA